MEEIQLSKSMFHCIIKVEKGYCWFFSKFRASARMHGLWSWRVTMSNTESEYIAMVEAVNDSLFVRNVLGYLIPCLEINSITVHGDNEGAISLAINHRARLDCDTLTEDTIFYAEK